MFGIGKKNSSNKTIEHAGVYAKVRTLVQELRVAQAGYDDAIPVYMLDGWFIKGEWIYVGLFPRPIAPDSIRMASIMVLFGITVSWMNSSVLKMRYWIGLCEISSD